MTGDPAAYDAWYETPRGRWIGDREFALLARMLGAAPGRTLLDVGCGTGYFSRRFAREAGLRVTGTDVDAAALEFARHRAAEIGFVQADARRLPFADKSFDHAAAVTSLCFVGEERRAVRELLRVARRGIVLGLLNRRSVLWLRKGRGGGSGAYAGARWHRPDDALALFDGLPAPRLRLAAAVLLPGGGRMAECAERWWPPQWLCGGFLAVSASP